MHNYLNLAPELNAWGDHEESQSGTNVLLMGCNSRELVVRLIFSVGTNQIFCQFFPCFSIELAAAASEIINHGGSYGKSQT